MPCEPHGHMGFKTDNDLIKESRPDGAEIVIISELEPIPIKPKDGGSDSERPNNARWIDLSFTTYAPLSHMCNVDFAAEGKLEFLELPHKRLGHASSLTTFSDLEVRIEFSFKDTLAAIVKWYNIKHGVNFHVTKSQVEKYKAKRAMYGTICLWKIMASVRKKSKFWVIRKYTAPHTYVVKDSLDFDVYNHIGNEWEDFQSKWKQIAGFFIPNSPKIDGDENLEELDD
ncbi:hypothetical protein PVK06_011199 [Gossypium arboreum]|uniref:Transposase MuDR plant domain-containing protein n=1 Tax=Gossypium arboreum TaxID=29729 RepID=A0ABR0Q9F2_GOSAR|nr:hypothetical protein PVK06_011199 [Gossypium arboreum]